MNSFTWRHVKDMLVGITEEQLDMPVTALIDAEPWDATDAKIAPANDPYHPNRPYLIFT